jgi:hypothetical protein
MNFNKKNYSKYSQKQNTRKEEKNDIKEIIVKEVNDKIKEDNENIKEDILKEEVLNIQNNKQKYIGIVTNCEALRIRKEPNVDSEILNVIKKMSKVDILDESDEYFYKIKSIGTNTEGYCMKKFIVKQNIGGI